MPVSPVIIALELFYKRFDSNLLICNHKNNTTLPTSPTSRVSTMMRVVGAGLRLKRSSLLSGSLSEGGSMPIHLLSPSHEGQSTGHVTVTKQQGDLSDMYTSGRKGLKKKVIHFIRHYQSGISIRTPLLKMF